MLNSLNVLKILIAAQAVKNRVNFLLNSEFHSSFEEFEVCHNIFTKITDLIGTVDMYASFKQMEQNNIFNDEDIDVIADYLKNQED